MADRSGSDPPDSPSHGLGVLRIKSPTTMVTVCHDARAAWVTALRRPVGARWAQTSSHEDLRSAGRTIHVLDHAQNERCAARSARPL
jgi:hypothetical protein